MGKKVLILLLSAAMLCSCATCPETGWQRSGATDEDFKKDYYECYRDAQGLPKTAPIYGGLTGALTQMGDLASQKEVFKKCMESKGWTRE